MKYLITFLSLLLIISCKKSTEPISGNNDFRRLNWNIDTLDNPGNQTIMTKIWGNSTNNLYLVGWGQDFGSMWNYNGKTWEKIRYHKLIAGTDYSIIDLQDIYGDSPNNIWVVGSKLYSNPSPPPNSFDSSMIIHFDGSEWRDEDIKKQRMLFCLGGEYPDHFWAGGYHHSLYKYVNGAWQKDSLIHPKFGNPDYYFNIGRIGGNSIHGFYLSALLYQDQNHEYTRYYLFKNINDKWIVQDSTWQVINAIWVSPAGVIYTPGSGMRTWDGSFQESELSNISLTGFYGIDDNNILITCYDWDNGGKATLYHYNGLDWYAIPGLKPGNNDTYMDVWSDGKEVFLVGFGGESFPEKSFVLHGK